MGKFYRRTKSKSGLPPGTLVYTGQAVPASVKISLIDYDKDRVEERSLTFLEECLPLQNSSTVSWINIDGLDPQTVQKAGDIFNIHPLVLEDILHVEQRPKSEDYGDYFFIVLKMLHWNSRKDEVTSEQMSLVLGRNYVISFQEKPGDIFDPLRERIRADKGRLRKSGADYLAYALVDAVVDHYFVVLEKAGDQIEDLEERIVLNMGAAAVKDLHRLRREMIFLRRQIWPLREVVNLLQRNESQLFVKSTEIFLRDVYDHTVQLIDTIELFRDMLSGMHDIYLSAMSNRMNEVMKILTMFASIFIPLTFIAGLYGMNFRYMPELKWHWGYFCVLGVMASIAGGMLIFFKRKKWF